MKFINDCRSGASGLLRTMNFKMVSAWDFVDRSFNQCLILFLFLIKILIKVSIKFSILHCQKTSILTTCKKLHQSDFNIWD